MNKFSPLLLLLVLACSTARKSIKDTLSDDWIPLLDKELSQWEVFMGVPHESVDLPMDHPKSKDGKTGTPLGLNNDPKNVFTTKINEEGEVELYITGEIFGALSSKKAYENYHFRCEFKWGEKKWKPRLTQKRDNGILYHCTGKHGAFWNVWMRCLELQVQEGDFGDFHPLAGAIADFKVKKVPNTEKGYIFDLDGTTKSVAYMPGFEVGRVIRSENHEKAHGEWNLLEVYTIGD
ncbi:MAG: family 16 glycoside hydrolase, partial [Bacteroidota bacterium]